MTLLLGTVLLAGYVACCWLVYRDVVGECRRRVELVSADDLAESA